MRFYNFGMRVRSWQCVLLLTAAVLAAGSPNAVSDVDPRRDATVEAIERVMPAVVNVSTTRLVEVQDLFEDFFGHYYGGRKHRGVQEPYSLGSGVIIDEDGYILTNDHVIRRADKIKIGLGTNTYAAKLIAHDSATDVALLKIADAPAGTHFRSVKLAKDDDIYLGETVIALGNPFGLGGSVSRGILSSKNRRPDSAKGPLEVEDWLQTDAAINPGNSGGPLIDLRGELIGLNVAILRDENAQGIGFAIPIKHISETLSAMYTPEGLNGIWFGARIRSNAGLPYISRVEGGSPADKAGLRPGDLVASVDQKVPRNFIEASELILHHQSRELSLTIRRGAETRDIRVHLGRLTDVIRNKTGLNLQELTPQLASEMQMRGLEGLLISAVDPDSPASSAQLSPGQLVIGVEGTAVNTVSAMARMVSSRKRGETVVLNVVEQHESRGLLRRVQGEVEVRLK